MCSTMGEAAASVTPTEGSGPRRTSTESRAHPTQSVRTPSRQRTCTPVKHGWPRDSRLRTHLGEDVGQEPKRLPRQYPARRGDKEPEHQGAQDDRQQTGGYIEDADFDAVGGEREEAGRQDAGHAQDREDQHPGRGGPIVCPCVECVLRKGLRTWVVGLDQVGRDAGSHGQLSLDASAWTLCAGHISAGLRGPQTGRRVCTRFWKHTLTSPGPGGASFLGNFTSFLLPGGGRLNMRSHRCRRFRRSSSSTTSRA